MDITEQQIAGALNVELTPQEQPQAAETGGTDLAAADAQQERAVTAGQTAEERHENAARRRRQEQETAIQEAVQKALAEQEAKLRAEFQQEKDDYVGGMKLNNTVTGKPINNCKDYEDYKRDFAEAKTRQKLKAGKLTEEELGNLIEQSPTVQAAKEIVRKNEEEKQAKQMEAAQTKMQSEIEAIHKMDPSINTIADLANAPYSKEFKEHIDRGLTFLEAYILCNHEAIQTAAAEAARNSAMLNSRGKDHLTGGNNARGAGAVSVPAADMAMFKLFNPKATPEEIQAYYNKNRK